MTWRWFDKDASNEMLVAVLSSRRSGASVADFVEQLYLCATSSAAQVVSCANRPGKRPHKARTPHLFAGKLQGDRVTCGANPFIDARLVSNLRVEARAGTGDEVVQWREPPTYTLQDGDPTRLVVDQEGADRRLVRPLGPLIQLTAP